MIDYMLNVLCAIEVTATENLPLSSMVNWKEKTTERPFLDGKRILNHIDKMHCFDTQSDYRQGDPSMRNSTDNETCQKYVSSAHQKK